MNITMSRFLELRDGKAEPQTREELVELARFEFRSESARIEQACAQRRPATPSEVMEMEREAVRKIMLLAERFILAEQMRESIAMKGGSA